jgi:creatinine deaminase
MCTGAILLYKIPRVVIGENVTFMGGEDLLRSRGVEVIVLDNQECKDLMKKFIHEKPEASRLFIQHHVDFLLIDNI